jgi:hypothetical protein
MIALQRAEKWMNQSAVSRRDEGLPVNKVYVNISLQDYC